MTTYEVIYDDLEVLSEIYDIEVLHYNMIKESVRRDHIIAVSENDPSIVVEGFYDLLGDVGEIIRLIIKKIKDFFVKINLLIKNHTSSINKFYNKNRKVLESLTDVDFSLSGYSFTLDVLPNLKPIYDTIEEYNDELAEIASMKIETILTRRNEFLAAGNLDSLRGQILGTNRPIRQDRFIREVREFYRNGQDLEQYIHIGDNEFTRTLSEIPQLEQDTKEMNRMKNELLTSLERVESFFNQKIPVVYSNGTSVVKLDKISVNDGKVTSNGTETILDEDRNKIEAYTRFKYNQIKELSNMASIVIMERANAYKDKVRMTEEILTKAIISGKMSE